MSEGARENSRQVKAGPPAGPPARPEGAAAAPGRWITAAPLEAAAQLCQRKSTGSRRRRARGLRRQRAAAARWGRAGRGEARRLRARLLARPRAPAGRAVGAPGCSRWRRRRPAVPGGLPARRAATPGRERRKWPGGGTRGRSGFPGALGPGALLPARPALPPAEPPRTRPRARPGLGREPAAGPARPRGDLNFAGRSGRGAMAERLAAAATGCFGPAYRSAPGLPSADRAGRGPAGNPLPDPQADLPLQRSLTVSISCS